MISNRGDVPWLLFLCSELKGGDAKYEASRDTYALIISMLSSIEVLEYNRSLLRSILEHETQEKVLHRKTEWGAT